MARYKYIDTNPRLLPVDLARQLLPGTFEHAVSHLIDHEIDLSHFDERYRNDETGAPAYPPAMLLKVVRCAYAHGIVSSRAIERVCQELARPCRVKVTETFNRPPCAFPAPIVDVIEAAASELDIGHMRLPSGAFHDANFIAEHAPTGMIFVPCEKGISHSPAENARPEDLAAGTRVLAASLVELDNGSA